MTADGLPPGPAAPSASESASDEMGRSLATLRALTAVARLRPGLSEAEMMRVIAEQLESLGLRGAVTMLDKDGRLVIRALAFPARELLAFLERLTGLHVLGFAFPVDRVEPYRRAVRTGETVFLEDSLGVIGQLLPENLSPLAGKILAAFGPQQSIFAPISAGGRLVGVLNVSARALSEADRAAVQVFAERIGAALENARLLREARDSRDAVLNMLEDLEETARQLRDKTERLTVLGQIARLASSSLDTDEVAEAVTGDVRRLIPSERSTIVLLDRETGWLRLCGVSADAPSQLAKGVRLPAGTAIERVLENGQPLVQSDLAEEAANPVERQLLQEGIRSTLVVPLIAHGQAIGSLNLGARSPHAYDAGHVALAQELAEHVSLAIANAQLHAAEHRRAQQLARLQEVVAGLGRELDPDAVLDAAITAGAAALAGAGDASICLLGDDGQTRTHIACLGPKAAQLLGRSAPAESGLHGEVLRTGQPLLANDLSHDPRLSAMGHEMGAERMIVVPLQGEGRVIGALSVFGSRDRRPFTLADQQVLGLFAAHAASALHNARLYRAVRRLADERSLIADVAVGSAAGETWDTIVAHATETLARLWPSDSVGFLLPDATGTLRPHASYRGVPAELIQTLRLPPGQGLTGLSAQTGQPIRVGDVTHDPRYVAGQPGIRSEMCVPLVASGRTLAVINVESQRADAFDDGDLRLLTALTGQLAIVLDRSRLFGEVAAAAEELAQRNRRLEALYAIDRAASQSLNLPAVLAEALEKTLEVLEINAGAILLPEADGGGLRLHVHRGLSGATAEEAGRARFDAGLAGRAARERRPVTMDIAEYDVERVAPLLEREGFRWLASVPLIASDRVVGALNLASRRARGLPQSEMDFLTSVGQQLGAAVENARLFAESQRLVEAERAQLMLARTLQQVGALLTAELTQGELLERLFDLLARVVAYDSVSVQLLDERGRMTLAAGRGFPSPELAERFIRETNTQSFESRWASRQVVVIPDTCADARWIPAAGMEYIHSWIGAPLAVKGQVIGILNVDSRTPGAYDAEVGQTVTAFANQAAIAIENARLYQQVRASEQRYRTLVENAAELIWTLDRDGRFTYVNRQAEDATGYCLETLRAREFGPFLLPEDRARVQHIFRGVLAGQSHSFEMRFLHADGRAVHLSVNAAPLYRDEEPPAIGAIAFGRDVSAQKQAEAALQQRMAELSALFHVSTSLRLAGTVEAMLPIILDKTLEVLGADTGALFLRDPAARRLTLRAARGRLAGLASMPLEYTGGVCHHVAQTRVPYAFDELARDPFTGDEIRPLVAGVMGGVCAPMITGGDLVGTFVVGSDAPRTFAEDEIRLFSAITEMAASAIRRAQLLETVQAHAATLEDEVAARTRELAEAHRYTRGLLENSPDALAIFDEHGSIADVNEATCHLTGRSRAELIGTLFHDYFTDRRAAIEMVARAFHVGHVRDCELMARAADGAVIPVSCNATVYRDEAGDIKGVIASARDITHQKELERLKDQFVSNVSHELRTPITSLKLYHGLLATRPEKRDAYLDRLQRETDRLEHIIEDLLRLSRMDQGQVPVKRTPVNLNALAELFVMDRQPLAASRGLTLSVNTQAGLPPVHADQGLIGQVLSILLTNAVNYTPYGGWVAVSTHSTERDGRRRIGFSVADGGPGIPPDEMPHLFERFFRGKAGHESGQPGTGLGLAIVKEIMERHRGEVEVESEPGRGTTFYIWLPA